MNSEINKAKSIILRSKNLGDLKDNLNRYCYVFQKYNSYSDYIFTLQNLPVFSKTEPTLDHKFYYSYDDYSILVVYGNKPTKTSHWACFSRSEKNKKYSFEEFIKLGYFKDKIILLNLKYITNTEEIISNKQMPYIESETYKKLH